jgi:hypothetical protein
MEEAIAEDVVGRLRAEHHFAHVNRRVGVYSVGVRVVIPDGREAIWDNDGAAGLEAMVLRDGVLVGFVPQLPDSDDLTAAEIAAIIAGTDYDAPVGASPPSHPTAGPRRSPAVPDAPVAAGRGAPAGARRWSDRLRRGFRAG